MAMGLGLYICMYIAHRYVYVMLCYVMLCYVTRKKEIHRLCYALQPMLCMYCTSTVILPARSICFIMMMMNDELELELGPGGMGRSYVCMYVCNVYVCRYIGIYLSFFFFLSLHLAIL